LSPRAVCQGKAAPGRVRNCQRVMAPSDEEQRLVQLYRKKGIKALVAELNKF